MPYRNQAEVLDKRLSQLYEAIDVSVAAYFTHSGFVLHSVQNILILREGSELKWT